MEEVQKIERDSSTNLSEKKKLHNEESWKKKRSKSVFDENIMIS